MDMTGITKYVLRLMRTQLGYSVLSIGGLGRSSSPCSRTSIVTTCGNVVDILSRTTKEEKSDGCGGASRRWGHYDGATRVQGQATLVGLDSTIIKSLRRCVLVGTKGELQVVHVCHVWRHRTAKNARRRKKYTSYHTMLSHSSKRSGQCIYAIYTVTQAAFVLFSMDHRVNDCTGLFRALAEHTEL